MKKLKTNKGITLIALVITIIVLLILAAVSIATLTGENGILSQATKAGDRTTEETEKEEIKLSFNAAKSQKYEEGDYIEKVTASEFDTELKKQDKDTEVTPNSDPIEVKFKNTGNIYTIIQDGTVDIQKNGGGQQSETGDNIVNKYGWKVSNYNVTTDEYTAGVWRLFYHDNEYAYLITDELVGDYKLSDFYNVENSKYLNGSNVSDIGKKLNSIISSLFVDTNTNENIRATAWLTDTNYWQDYTNEDAAFAIGSPTIELFANSYNTILKKEVDDEVYEYSQILLDKGNNGYIISSGGEVLDYCHGIHRIGDDYHWWIASPYDYNYEGETATNYEFYIYGGDWYTSVHYNSGGAVSKYTTENSLPVRPIVGIPIDTFKAKYESSLVDE